MTNEGNEGLRARSTTATAVGCLKSNYVIKVSATRRERSVQADEMFSGPERTRMSPVSARGTSDTHGDL